uniref:E3 SUMO-protein ligase RNF212 n=1 Tax=Propithecus coquereli TaxID=379532 RepID=A0A2K6G410_PROCO
KKDECLICKVPCRTVLLSKHTDSDIQAFFVGIDSLCKKYSRETSQISEFQEKHRKRLLAFYREKISKLEESLRKATLQIEQLQSMRSSQQAAFSTLKNSVSTKPRVHPLQPPRSSAPDRLESMEVDLTPSPMRKPEVAAGPARISLISPPQDGRMATLSHSCFLFHPMDWLCLTSLSPCVLRFKGSPFLCIDFCLHWILLLLSMYVDTLKKDHLFPFYILVSNTMSVVPPFCQSERK